MGGGLNTSPGGRLFKPPCIVFESIHKPVENLTVHKFPVRSGTGYIDSIVSPLLKRTAYTEFHFLSIQVGDLNDGLPGPMHGVTSNERQRSKVSIKFDKSL